MARKKNGPLFHAKARKGLEYTQRQLDILNDEIPLYKISTTELIMLMRRASERDDERSYSIAQALHEAKTNPTVYVPQISEIEAKMILQRLTPWTINWEPKKKKKEQKKSSLQ